MATGTLSSGICFASQAAAARNECSVSSKFFAAGMYTCQGIVGAPSETDGGAYLMSYTQRYQSSPTAFSSSTVSTQLQACQVEDYWPMPISVNNGLLLGAAIAGVWLLAWAARSLSEVLRSDEGYES